MVRLRITQRCARDDLGLEEHDQTRDAVYIAVCHEAIRVFVGKRSNAPGDGENVLHVCPYGHIKSLHIGQGRGATIYDDEVDVCWLLAYSETHATGERRDAYAFFERLDSRGELLPSDIDYATLGTVTEAKLMDELRVRSGNMYDIAREQSGKEVSETFVLDDGQDASITVAIELMVEETESAEQGWMSFVLPYDSPLGLTQLLDLVADLIPPHVNSDTVELAGDIGGRSIAHNELAFTWSHYSSL